MRKDELIEWAHAQKKVKAYVHCDEHPYANLRWSVELLHWVDIPQEPEMTGFYFAGYGYHFEHYADALAFACECTDLVEIGRAVTL